MTLWRLIDRDTRAIVVARLEIADGFWSRFRGLQFRARLAAGTGLLLVPCASVHTFFMRFAIDVVLLDRGGRVLAVRRAIPPWSIVPPVADAHMTLELPASTANVVPGDVLQIVSAACGLASAR